jgi:hypothetical protein
MLRSAVERRGIVAAMVLPCAVLSAQHAIAAGPQKGATAVSADQSDFNQAAEERIQQWLGLVWRLGLNDYTPLDDLTTLPDGARVAQDSRSWAGQFLTSAANPYEGRRTVRRTVHRATADTFDTLRHEYEALGKRLVMEETVNFLLLTVDSPPADLQATNERTKQEEIQGLAALVLRMSGTRVAENLQPAPYQWVLRFPTPIAEGARFSSAPEQDLRRMWSWASRVDGGIHRGRVYFLAFKKRESTSGRNITPDGQHWFDGKCWDVFR